MKRLLLTIALLAPAIAHAQSTPGFTNGQIPSTAQWNGYFAGKTDVNGGKLNNATVNNATLASPTISNPTISGGNVVNSMAGNAGAVTAAQVAGALSGQSIGAADATATGGTTARTLANWWADRANVLGFGADPTGVADSSAAINAAGTATQFGSMRCVYLPAGTYYLKNYVSAQCLIGDGMSLTTLTVDQNFSSTALGVIVVPSGTTFPVIRDIGVSFAQPTTQGTRGNFLTLAQSCTSGSSGTGCKYPPAIYDANTSQRIDMRNVFISGAWDGIDLSGNVGAGTIQDIYVGALDIGLQADGIKDWTHIKSIHFWNFGFPTADNIYSVFSDGSTLAAQIGRIDGASIQDFDSFIGGLSVTANWTWGFFDVLQLDGGQLNIAASSSAPAVTINGLYMSYSGDTGCQVNVTSGRVTITPSLISASVPVFCVSGTNSILQVTGGRIAQNSGSHAIAEASGTGVTLALHGVLLDNNTGADSAPIIDDTSDSTSAIIVTDNDFSKAATGGEAVSISTDGASKHVSGNNFNGWTFTPPGALGVYQAPGATSPLPLGASLITSTGRYNLPLGWHSVQWKAIGGAGGSGCGYVGTSGTAESAGATGGPGYLRQGLFTAGQYAVTSLTVTVGAAGASCVASGTTSGSSGSAATAGTASYLTVNSVTFPEAYGGGAAANGQSNAASGGGASGNIAATGNNGSGSTPGAAQANGNAGNTYTNTYFGVGPGGANGPNGVVGNTSQSIVQQAAGSGSSGSGLAASPVAIAGPTAGANWGRALAAAGGLATCTGTSQNAQNQTYVGDDLYGNGGAGGASCPNSTGGNGGNAAGYGASGGGGGATLAGFLAGSAGLSTGGAVLLTVQ